MLLPSLKTTNLIDRYGRIASNLRISVIDKCNLTCRYCLVSKSSIFLKNEDLLSFQEIKDVTKVFAELGVNQLRITGGEPFLRPNVTELIKELKQIPGIKRLSITTNGVLLGKYIDELEEIGISGINISLDTLDPSKFKQITKQDYFDKVMDNIHLATTSSIPIKLNCVGIKGFNDNELFDFVNFAINYNITLRFIEFMPFTGNNWVPTSLLSAKEIKEKIEERFKLVPEPLEHLSQTSRVYKIKEFPGKIGFIASVTESFCKWCNRLRLTADGNLRTCLNDKHEVSLKAILRGGISSIKLKNIIIENVMEKPKEHKDFLNPDFKPPRKDREMIRIGG